MKIAIVTGSAGNLGQAIVQKFLSEGYRVIGTVTKKDTAAKLFADSNFEEAVVDLSSEEAAATFIEETASKFGAIDVAILTVGGYAKGTIEETTTSQVVKQYNLNFATSYNIAQPVFKKMMAQHGGRIFLTGSRPGLDAKSSKGMVAYGLAKSLLLRLAELMNVEGSNNNVITSMIVPSTIDTPVNRKFMPDADFDSWVKPETIADIVFFYCTDAAAALREPVIKIYGNA